MYPNQFHYLVSQNYRNDMIRELVQIQVYVKEMEETIDVPADANCTTIALSHDNTLKNQVTAADKEKEYLKKAQSKCQVELSTYTQMQS